MFCVYCNTQNEPDTTYCVSCGRPVAGGATLSPPAAIGRPARSISPVVWVAGASLLLIALFAIGIFFVRPRIAGADVLPDHLGMFVQSAARDRVDEVRRDDFSSVSEARNVFAKNDSLPTVDPQPVMILFADGKDVPTSDLRLVPIDAIKDDGSIKQIDIQASPVEGKPDMKRLRLPDALANGKYAFALLDGFFNEGKHKFWAFQVKNSGKTDNGDMARAATIDLKPVPKQAGPPKPASANAVSAAPPAPGYSAVSITDALVLRSGPGQAYPKIRNISRGEQLLILGYSDNTESFKGRASPFAQVKAANGDVGWVFSAFLR